MNRIFFVISIILLTIIFLFCFLKIVDINGGDKVQVKQNNLAPIILPDTLVDMSLKYFDKYKMIGVISPSDCYICYSSILNEFNNLSNNNNLQNSIAVYILDKYNSGSSFRENLRNRFRPRFPIFLKNKNNLVSNNFCWFIKTPFLLQINTNGVLENILQININNQETFFRFIDHITEKSFH